MAVTLPIGFSEVKAPEQFKFERIGDTLQGKLIRATPREFEDKDTHERKTVAELFVATAKGVRTFLPGFDVRSKLDPLRDFIGKELFIVYSADDEGRGKGGNAMKVFIVAAKGETAPSTANQHGVFITDADIPF